MKKDEEAFKRNKLSELYKQLTTGQKDKFAELWDYNLEQVPPKDLDRAVTLCERTIKNTQRKRGKANGRSASNT